MGVKILLQIIIRCKLMGGASGAENSYTILAGEILAPEQLFPEHVE